MEREEYVSRYIDKVFEGIIAIISTCGFMYCILSYYDIEIPGNTSPVMIIILLSCLITVLCIERKISYITIPAALLIWGLFVLKYYKDYKPYDMAFMAALFVLIAVSMDIYILKNAALQIVITAVMFAVCLLTDHFPDTIAFFVWIASVLGTQCMRNKTSRIYPLLIMLSVFVMMIAVNTFISIRAVEVLKPYIIKAQSFQQKINLSIADGFNESRFNISSYKMDIDGILTNADPGDSENIDVIVTLEKRPENTIYLRGFIGDAYSTDGWSEISEEALKNDIAGWENTGIDYNSIKRQLNNEFWLSAGGDVERTYITVENAGYNGTYLLLPYGVYTGDDEVMAADGEIINFGDTKRTYQYMPSFYDMQTEAAQDYIIRRYTEYVYEKYAIPETRLENLMRISARLKNDNIYEAVEALRNYLAANCTYSKKLAPVPYGIDFAENFVVTQKKGYCTHFATAGVLMLRMMGYPARYVAGYAAFPQDFERNGDGSYTAYVKENHAHAWVEVYINGIWYPVEMTPGYVEEAAGFPEKISDSNKEAVTEAVTENTAGEENVPQEDGEESSQENFEEAAQAQTEPLPKRELSMGQTDGVETASLIDGFRMMLGLVKYVVIIIVIVLVRRCILITMNKKHMNDSDKRKALKYVVMYTIKMLSRAGYGKKSMTDSQYAEHIMIPGFDRFIMVAQKEKYSGEDISDEELTFCRNITSQVEEKLYSETGKYMRFVWKYVYCYR